MFRILGNLPEKLSNAITFRLELDILGKARVEIDPVERLETMFALFMQILNHAGISKDGVHVARLAPNISGV